MIFCIVFSMNTIEGFDENITLGKPSTYTLNDDEPLTVTNSYILQATFDEIPPVFRRDSLTDRNDTSYIYYNRYSKK